MAMRSIASLSLSFGLVTIPVKLYSAGESSANIRFNLLSPEGKRLKQQYVVEGTSKPVERSEMKKGYEIDKDRFVVFSAEELEALENGASHIVEILGFIPEGAIDQTYFDKAYFIAPDRRGGKPYSLLQRALQESHRCALAKWSLKSKTHIVQIRATNAGLAITQLLFADEVRDQLDLHIEQVPVSDAELKLALQIIEQGAIDNYDPSQYKDEEKERILKAIDDKIEGKAIVSAAPEEVEGSGQVIDLMEALRASLSRGKTKTPAARPSEPADAKEIATKARRPAKRTEKVEEPTPARVRARK
ncbi:Ku protein [Paraburkholderia sp. SIMBA_054]|uniref:non-homologous end joining protein Ku n=1 Tax=Paraburkholderia sp. SIMBA_054 TaxID=3085795 RepID=UPI00397C941F